MSGIRAVGIVIKNSQVLLIHRLNEGSEYWVLPGGGVEPNETVEAAVVRELKEETSLDVKICLEFGLSALLSKTPKFY